MKKIILSFVCVFIALSASAQRASSSSTSFFSTEASDQPITFGIRGGVNFANVSTSEDGYTVSYKSNTGFHAGMIVDIPLMESLYLQSGLYYIVKGYKESDEITANPAYLEIPILASYRYNFSDAAQLQVNFGPYLAYGISGKIKEEYRGESHEEDYFNDHTNKFDAGLQVGAGITISQHFYLGIAYEFGLTNVLKDSGDDSMKNTNFLVSVGYNF